MRKYLLATLSVAALGFANQAVLAADVETAPAANDWSGPYLGVQAGYSFGESRHTNEGGIGTTGDFELDGLIGGLTAGWNHQFDGLVVGLEGDISGADIEGDVLNICVAPGCESEIDWLGTARLRAGFAMDSLLLYATGGLAVGGISAEVQNGAGGYSRDKAKFGWTVGGGAEWGATESLSFKVEYLFVDLGSLDYGPSPQVIADFDENHIVRAGLNWRF